MGSLTRAALIGTLAVRLFGSAPVAAQVAPAPTAVTVDYVSADGVYLPVGADQGLTLGDTIPVFTDAAATTPAGRLVLTSVTRRRSVAQPVEASLTIARGDVVYLPLVAPEATAAAQPTPVPAGPVVASGRAQSTRSAVTGPRVSGRISLDLDARETRTSWSGALFGETRRRFATPTSRLSLMVSDLPGGITIRTNLRATYRYADEGLAPPPTSIRAYEAVAIKSFDGAPVEVMLGRFSNPYESYSAYWDGLLLRVGGRRGGVGVVAGFEPSLYNERPSSALPKVTGFADVAFRGDGWRYSTDMSVHYLRPSDGSTWSYAGWTQRLSVGPLDLSQRLRVDGGIDGRTPELGDVRVRARLDVAGPLGVHGSYGHTGNSQIAPAVRGSELTLPLTLLPRDEFSAGFDLSRSAGSLWVDAGQSKRLGDEAGRFVSGNGSVALGGARLLLSGRYWWRGDSKSIGAAPALSFGIGSTRWRAGYRYYRTESTTDPISTSAAQLLMSTSVMSSVRLTVGGEHQWGTNLGGDRVQLSLARTF